MGRLIHLIRNPHVWFCILLAWIVTNGWAYLLLGVGLVFHIHSFCVVAAAYLAFLWLPFTPEKIVTAFIAIKLLKLLFPQDSEAVKSVLSFARKI